MKVLKAIEKQIPMRVRYDDSGYDQYHKANLYGAFCPDCRLLLMEFSDNDGDVEGLTPERIREAFLKEFRIDAYEGRNQYCERCGRKLKW